MTHSTFQLMRETVAHKWARQAKARLALATKLADDASTSKAWRCLTLDVESPGVFDHSHTWAGGFTLDGWSPTSDVVGCPFIEAPSKTVLARRRINPFAAATHTRPDLESIDAEIQTMAQGEALALLDEARDHGYPVKTWHRAMFDDAYKARDDERWINEAMGRGVRCLGTRARALVHDSESWDGFTHTKRDNHRLIDLERQADAFLRAADAAEHKDACLDAIEAQAPDEAPIRPKLLKIDVVDRWTRQLTVAPDAVAFRGKVRRRPTVPARYHNDAPAETVTLPASYPGAVMAWFYGLPAGTRTVQLYRTDRVGRDFAWIGSTVGRWHFGSKLATGVKVRSRRQDAKRRARTAVTRVNTTGRRGKAVTAWKASARTLPRVMARASEATRERAATLEAQLIGAPMGQLTLIGTVAVMRDTDGATVRVVRAIDQDHEPSLSERMSTREAARRLALAGVA